MYIYIYFGIELLRYGLSYAANIPSSNITYSWLIVIMVLITAICHSSKNITRGLLNRVNSHVMIGHP